MNLTLDRLKKVYQQAVVLWRDISPHGREIAGKRAATDRQMGQLARDTAARFDGTVLVDGMWDNPNYWLRYSLLRAALGLAHGREVGVIGQFRRRQVDATLKALGIQRSISFPDVPVPQVRKQALSLCRETRCAADVLKWTLPGGVHPAIVYDGILKRQRLATLDVNRTDFLPLVEEALIAIARAQAILNESKPDLVVISHPFNFTYGSLAWLALSSGIPVVMPYGLFGVCRFVRFTTPQDLFDFYDRPSRAEIDALPEAKATAMAEVGRRYLQARLGGRADDLASLLAFRRNDASIDRAKLCELHGWDLDKPIVAFYASNWFDWPHQLGMTQFRDFLDWTEATFAVAAQTKGVNWLFKPHPAEHWFGGVRLQDMLGETSDAKNIAIADDWNNGDVMQAIDALITYHGTAGVEFAAVGKPVLVPDRGKYDDCGFVKVAASRDEYLNLLRGPWWDDMDLQETKRRAEIFAGWWFCAPDWQGQFILADDSRQDELYGLNPMLLSDNKEIVEKEIAAIGDWWKSGRQYYHTWKMAVASGYRLGNVMS